MIAGHETLVDAIDGTRADVLRVLSTLTEIESVGANAPGHFGRVLHERAGRAAQRADELLGELAHLAGEPPVHRVVEMAR